MKKRTEYFLGLLMAVFFIVNAKCDVYASDDGQEYITISVDASDTSGQLQYALDTDVPSAFSYSNEFSVPAGSSHTIYVKDAAGNISSQEFTPITENTVVPISSEGQERTVNIDVTLGNDKQDNMTGNHDPAEDGQGSIYDQVTSTGNDDNSPKIFYTVTTKDGEVFYLIIDQTTDGNDNVYLLDQVKVSDLNALAKDDSGTLETQGTSSLLDVLNTSPDESETSLPQTQEKTSSKNNTTTNGLIIIIIAAIVGGIYYYFKIYKNKKDEQMDLVDALDKDDFAIEEEDDDDEVDFGLDDDYQEKVMSELLNDDDIPEEEDDETADISTDTENPDNSLEDNANTEQDYPIYATSHNEESGLNEYEEDEYDEDLDAPDEEE